MKHRKIAFALIFSLFLCLLSGCAGVPNYSDPNLDVSSLSPAQQYEYYQTRALSKRTDRLLAPLLSLDSKGNLKELDQLSKEYLAFGKLMTESFSSQIGGLEAGTYLSLAGEFLSLFANGEGEKSNLEGLANQIAAVLETFPKEASADAKSALVGKEWFSSRKPFQLISFLSLPQKEEREEFVITLGGNLFLGNPQSVTSNGLSNFGENHPLGSAYPLLYCMPYFLSDDLTLLTYEGCFTKGEAAVEDGYLSDEKFLTSLKASGVDLLNLSTDHSGDFYHKGLTDTSNALADQGITAFWDHETIFLETRIGKIAFLSFDCVSTQPDVSLILRQDMNKANAKGADIIIVTFHWGEMESDQIQDYQMTYGRLASAYGADLVLGSHPYRLQGMEYTKQGRGIFYSLGNLCHGADGKGDYPDTALVQIKVTKEKGNYDFTNYQVIPMTRSPYPGEEFMPMVATGEDYRRIETAILSQKGSLKDSIQTLGRK